MKRIIMNGCKSRGLTIILTLLVSACDPGVRGVALHIGDSLMESTVDFIQIEEVRKGQAVLSTFNALATTGLKDNNYWVPRIENISATVKVDIMFISLGGNDAMADPFQGATFIADSVDAIMQVVNPGTVVYWIPPHDNIGGQRDTVFQEIMSASDRWQNLNVLDFDLWVASKGLDKLSLLRSDGVHLSGKGEIQWAKMIQNAIDSELPVQ